MAGRSPATEAAYTVDEALVAAGFGRFQALVFAYAGMGWVAEAMEIMLLSFVGPSVRAKWGLSAGEESLVATVVFAGMLLGAYTWGIISDNFGRRKGFLYTAIVTSAAGMLSSFAPNYHALLALRFFVGVGLGGGPVLVSWFLEFVPAPNRGAWMIAFAVFWSAGAIFEASLAWAVMPTLGWRWLLMFSSLPFFLLLLFYVWTPESPRYLCTMGKSAAAQQILEKLARINRATLPPGRLVLDRKLELQENEHPDDGNGTQTGPDIAINKGKSRMGVIGSIRVLLSRKLAALTVLIWVVFFGNAFSYYGLVLLTSGLNSESEDCKSGAKKSSGLLGESLYRNVLITTLAEFPGILISALMIDTLGRKISMASMFFVSCVCLLPLLFPQKEILMICLLFGARACITASFNIIYIYAPEVYPTTVRATGLGIASSMGRVGGMVCPLVAVGLLHSCHQTMAIILFEVVMLGSGLSVLLFPLETKGRDLSETLSTDASC